jgi:DNA-binding GntR family transcriptional regulator
VSDRHGPDAQPEPPATAPRSSWGAYARIADALRARLLAGEYKPGELLPSEAALCEEYRVVRNTVRRAYAVLEAEGLIGTLPGRGRIARQPGTPDRDSDSAPQYRRIATDLRAQITTGTLRPGDALPSEAALMHRYQVARGTARQALAELEGAGLIESTHGKGRFVRQPPDPPPS